MKSHVPLSHGLSQIVTKSTTGCSISRTVVCFPCKTVMHGDFPPLSIDKPPENIVNVSLGKYNLYENSETMRANFVVNQARFKQ